MNIIKTNLEQLLEDFDNNSINGNKRIIEQIIKMISEKPDTKKDDYRIVMSKFIGDNTYQLTFNKSLVHTGRFTDIENGLNHKLSVDE